MTINVFKPMIKKVILKTLFSQVSRSAVLVISLLFLSGTLQSFYAQKRSETRAEVLNYLIKEQSNRLEFLLDSTGLSQIDKGYIKGHIPFRKNDFDSALMVWNKEVERALQNQDSSLLSAFHYKMAVAYFQSGNTKDGQLNFQKSYEISIALDDSVDRMYALNGLALVETNIGNYEKSIAHFEEAIAIAKKIERKKFLWTLYYGISEAHTYQSHYSVAYGFGLKALKVGEELLDTVKVAKSNLALGIILYTNDEFRQSIKHLKESRLYFESIHLTYWIGVVDINLTASYEELNELDSALIYALKCEKTFEQLKILPQLYSARNNLASLYLSLKDYNKGIEVVTSTLKELENGKNKGFQSSMYNVAASLYFNTRNYRKAIEMGDKGLKLMSKQGREDDRISLLNVLSNSYNEIGNFKEALKYSELKFKELQKSKRSEELKEVAVLQANHKHEKEKIQLENKQLQKDLVAQQAISKRENLILISLVLLVAIVIIAFLIYRLYNSKRNDNVLLEKSNLEIQKQAEQLEEMDKIKSRFFTNISHEFRTPLTLIKGPVDQLYMKYEDTEDRKVLSSIRRNANRLLSLINQILELSELQSKERDLKLACVEVPYFVKRVVGSFESLANMRNIILSYEVETDDNEVCMEIDSIEKVLVNLLSNSFKFTQNGGTITVVVKSYGDWLKLVVSDSGVGINRDELDKIFEMFYYTESDRAASSGIGLALINELVKNHQGSIQVESELGKGSSFVVSIPVSKTYYDVHNVSYVLTNSVVGSDINYNLELDVIGDLESGVIEEKDETDKETILVVEDNAEIRLFVYEMLKDSYKVLEAEDGEKGIKLAIEYVPDLIVSDVMMPKVNGFEASKRLKEDERTCHIPIILLTAKGDKESKLEGLSINIDDYLLKPFDQDELKLRIKNLIDNRKIVQAKFSSNLKEETSLEGVHSMDQLFVQKVQNIVEKRIDDPDLSVDELAKLVGVSRSQLHRKIVALTGKSTSVFIRNIRLKKAFKLLKRNQLSISEICYEVGFSSPSYFNRCFKEYYQITPKQAILS